MELLSGVRIEDLRALYPCDPDEVGADAWWINVLLNEIEQLREHATLRSMLLNQPSTARPRG